SVALCHTSFVLRSRPLRSALFPYTTLFRSSAGVGGVFEIGGRVLCQRAADAGSERGGRETQWILQSVGRWRAVRGRDRVHRSFGDRKSTRLNSSHLGISYAVFCLKKKKKKQ